MGNFFNIDWAALFIPDIPLFEIFIRGTVMYLGLFLLLRFVMKRESTPVSITDLLVIVLLADASQNAMSGSYQSITNGVLLVLVIVSWSFALDWLGYHFKFMERLVHPPALPLVKNGKIIKQNLRKEFITEEELGSLLREQGIDDIQKVKSAYLEGDGQVSVIQNEEKHHKRTKPKTQ